MPIDFYKNKSSNAFSLARQALLPIVLLVALAKAEIGLVFELLFPVNFVGGAEACACPGSKTMHAKESELDGFMYGRPLRRLSNWRQLQQVCGNPCDPDRCYSCGREPVDPPSTPVTDSGISVSPSDVTDYEDDDTADSPDSGVSVSPSEVTEYEDDEAADSPDSGVSVSPSEVTEYEDDGTVDTTSPTPSAPRTSTGLVSSGDTASETSAPPSPAAEISAAYSGIFLPEESIVLAAIAALMLL